MFRFATFVVLVMLAAPFVSAQSQETRGQADIALAKQEFELLRSQ